MKRKVLVVDDDPRVRRLVTATLGSDYQLLQAQDGGEALDIATRERPDVVLLDVTMPKMDGFEVCKRLRADGAFRQTKVIMLTGLGSDDDRTRGLEAGCDAYFVKPFSPRALLDKLDDLLG